MYPRSNAVERWYQKLDPCSEFITRHTNILNLYKICQSFQDKFNNNVTIKVGDMVLRSDKRLPIKVSGKYLCLLRRNLIIERSQFAL